MSNQISEKEEGRIDFYLKRTPGILTAIVAIIMFSAKINGVDVSLQQFNAIVILCGSLFVLPKIKFGSEDYAFQIGKNIFAYGFLFMLLSVVVYEVFGIISIGDEWIITITTLCGVLFGLSRFEISHMSISGISNAIKGKTPDIPNTNTTVGKAEKATDTPKAKPDKAKSTTNGDLTANFSLHEFACKDGTPVPEEYYPNVAFLANNLQVLRDYLNEKYSDRGEVSVDISSGYRTWTHHVAIYNKKNPPKGSKHLIALAGDLKSKQVTPKEIHTAILHLVSTGKMNDGGIGVYNTFVHYDASPQNIPRRW